MLIAFTNPQIYPWLLFVGAAIIALVLIGMLSKLLSIKFFTKKEHHDMDDSPWEDLMGEKNDKNKRK
jgi:hypothetical protein